MSVASRFVLYTTIAGIFSSALVLRVGVGIQFFYVVMIVNLFVMLLMKRLWFPAGLVMLFMFLIASGATGILRGTDSAPNFLKEFLGISISGLYFCSFFRLMNFDVKECFRVYARAAYWVSIAGFILLPVHWALFSEYRLRSFFAEPAAYTSVCLPALYYFADAWQRRSTQGKELLIMSVAFLFAQSSVGFIGILFGMCVFFTRFRRGRLLMPVAVLFSGAILYVASSDFSLRLNDSVVSLQKTDVTGANLSTYALFSNLFVMENVVARHPFLGNGLGSHVISYHKYVGDLTGNGDFSDRGLEGINSEDAGSFTIRVLSDMGFLGAGLVALFLWRYRPGGEQGVSEISKAITVYFFVALLREGLYFSNEEFFFIVIYAIIGTAARRMPPISFQCDTGAVLAADTKPVKVLSDGIESVLAAVAEASLRACML